MECRALWARNKCFSPLPLRGSTLKGIKGLRWGDWKISIYLTLTLALLYPPGYSLKERELPFKPNGLLRRSASRNDPLRLIYSSLLTPNSFPNTQHLKSNTFHSPLTTPHSPIFLCYYLLVMEKHPIILFDGVCNLCTWGVHFVIKRDPEKQFKFSSIQSNYGGDLYQKHGFQPEAIETFILLEQGRSFSKSTGAIRVASRLSGLWPMVKLLFIIPRPIRDLFYDIVLRNRYRLFGKKDSCMVPSEKVQDRFID